MKAEAGSAACFNGLLNFYLHFHSFSWVLHRNTGQKNVDSIASDLIRSTPCAVYICGLLFGTNDGHMLITHTQKILLQNFIRRICFCFVFCFLNLNAFSNANDTNGSFEFTITQNTSDNRDSVLEFDFFFMFINKMKIKECNDFH